MSWFNGTVHIQQIHVLIPLIVTFQNMCDFLDNLCDRSTSLSEYDFYQLHQALFDAVNPQSSDRNYYMFRKEQEDGGYLKNMVQKCQHSISLLPSYERVQETICQFVTKYYILIGKEQGEGVFPRTTLRASMGNRRAESSLIETAKENGLNPFQYLVYLFQQLPQLPDPKDWKDLDKLLLSNLN